MTSFPVCGKVNKILYEWKEKIMQKVRRRWKDRRRSVFTAVLVFCLAVLLPSWVSAAETRTDTQIEFLYDEDVYITGFLSEAPEQQLHWRNTMSYADSPAFCLPASADSGTVQIHFQKLQYNKETGEEVYVPETGYVMINGEKVYSGDAVELPQSGGTLDIGFANGNTANVSIKKSANIASMFVNTESGDMKFVNANKENKEKADMLLIRADGTVDYNSTLKHIKGRGNATWAYAKRPYNIKLDTSTSLLGLGKAKGWCLLANYLDTSLLRNKIVYNLADETGIPFNMACESVDFYTNGEYQGTYLLTEKVEIDKNRVNITDMEKATEEVNTADLDSYPAGGTSESVRNTRKWVNIPNDPEDITGGYLIELELNDRYAAEACGFVTTRGQSVTMKAPEFVSQAQINYIADFYQDMEDALYSDTGYNSKGKHFSEYIDEESIAKMYLIQEYSLNLDTSITSFYLYKDSDLAGDGKLHMAPVWDFDVAIGNHAGRDGVSLTDPEVWWANRAQIYNIGGLNLLAQAVQHDSVKKLIVEQWNEVFRPAVRALLGEETDYVPEQLKTLAEYEQEISASAEMNFFVWPETLAHQGTGVQNGENFEASVAYVRNFLTTREAFMNEALAYGSGSGYERLEGTVTIEGTMEVGGTLTAQVTGSNGKNFTYQWFADGKEIEGAVEASYVLTEAEAGKVISVAVKDADGNCLANITGVSSEKVPGGDPDPEKPDPEKPDPEQPDPEQPDPEKPDPEKPEPGQEDNKKPIINPTPEAPVVQNPVKLASSAVTKVKSTKKGVKVQFTKVENAASYDIYRKAGTVYTKLGNTKELSFTDKTPVGGKKVSYAVKAVSGNPAQYTDADYGTEKEIKLPKAPQKLKAKAQGGKKVALSWKKVKGASAYLIYRADSKKGTYKLVGRVKKQSSVKYTDSRKLKKGKKYYYKIAALQGGKYSPLGKAVKVTVK